MFFIHLQVKRRHGVKGAVWTVSTNRMHNGERFAQHTQSKYNQALMHN
jgi:hypothetical protein